jgi:hypothetical protein
MSADPESPLGVSPPDDLLAAHPTTAYFWGHVAGSGAVADGTLSVTTTDADAAAALAGLAGGAVEHETTSRAYAHDTAITRTEDEYEVTITREDLFGVSGALGLPVDGRGTYRFRAFRQYDRTLLRGILEGCGAICFKSSQDAVGISFVHEDPALLETTRELIADCPVDAPVDDLAATSSGGYWFGVDDDAAAAFGRWLYEGCAETGLFAPSRRRKLDRSLAQAGADT